jgi:hypothetical protein
MMGGVWICTTRRQPCRIHTVAPGPDAQLVFGDKGANRHDQSVDYRSWSRRHGDWQFCLPAASISARIRVMNTRRPFANSLLVGKLSLLLVLTAAPSSAEEPAMADLAKLTPGRTKAENALWIENKLSARFNSSKRVVVADIKGPAAITMIHFAMPETL